MRRERKRRTKIIIGLVSVLLLMTVGYAAFQTNLRITGTSSINNSWNIEIIDVSEGTSINGGENASAPTHTTLSASMEANLYEKGDAVEYDITVKNKGTVDARLIDITNNISSNNDAIKVTFSNYTKGEVLEKNSTKVIKAKIEYDPNYEGEIDRETSTEVSITLNFQQAKGGGNNPTPNTYLLTYNCTENGSSDCTNLNEYYYPNESIDLTKIGSKKSQYIFQGWNTDKNAIGGLEELQMGEEDKTLYAIYKEDHVTINSVNTSSTTNSITVVVSAEADSGIAKYAYSMDGTNYTESSSNIYTFTGLQHNKTYPITVKVIANSDKEATQEVKDNSCPYSNGKEWQFPYTGSEQSFTSECFGTYTFEVWGAKGGDATAVQTYHGGYGGYSTGTKELKKPEILYINVGGKGVGATSQGQSLNGGYNGGGAVTGLSTVNHITASGGGATHIATKTGLLKDLNENKNAVLIVAGGGGGGRDQANHVSAAKWGYGGAGGGTRGQGALSSFTETTDIFTEATTLAGTQSSGCSFGGGCSVTGNSAGGGGWYGGYGGNDSFNYNGTNNNPGSGSGGSGYIGGVDNGNTIAGTSSMPTHNGTSTMTGNAGDGYAKITLGTKDINIPTQKLNAPTYTETVNGEVTINYPSGCGNKYTCKYIKNSDSEQTVTNDPTLYFGTAGTITAIISDGTNTVTSTYTVERTELYVKSNGNDSTGYGTIQAPYATLTKAYNSASTTLPSTIKVMDNITQTSTTTMNSDKDITLTSCTKSSNTSCPTSASNTITRGNSLTTYLVNNQAGTLTLKDITIDGNNVESQDAMIDISSHTFIENGTTLKRAKNINDFGGAARIINNGVLTINGGEISNNNSTTSGGTAVFNGNGTLTINGGTLTNNKAGGSGGAIWSCGNCTINLNGGSITNNTAGNHGGGICSRGIFNITGGTISGNTTVNRGGGIYGERYRDNDFAEVTITGGTISNNSAEYGGGILMDGTSTLTMNNGLVQNNTSSNEGAGVYANTNSTFIMNNGTISGNAATKFGGGVQNNGSVTITGGTISQNTANVGAGINSNKSVIVSGGTITNNTAKDTGGGIGAAGTLTISNTAKIKSNNSRAGAGINCYQCTLTINNGEISNNTATENGGGIQTLSTSTATINGGTISNNTAGASGTGGGGGINLTNSGKLSLTGGTISGNKGCYSGGMHVQAGATATITGGTITNNSTTVYSGGGMEIYGTVSITGGNITNNTAHTNGGGIRSFGGANVSIGGTANIKDNNASSTAESNISMGDTLTDLKSGFANTGSNYKIASALNNNFVLDVTSGNDSNSTVRMYTYSNSNRYKWQIRPFNVVNGTVYYYIRSALTSNRYLEIAGAAADVASGNNMEIWGTTLSNSVFNADGDFFWYFTKSGDYYIPRHYPTTKGSFCIHAASASNGATATANTCNNSNNQKWKFVAV